MKSSEPLFTRQNPFKPASRGRKTHYYPSRLHSLSEEEKQTSLSPERLKKQPTAQNHQQQSEKHGCPPGVTDEEVVFTEIWPSFEWHLSPTSTTTSDGVSPEVAVQQEPALAKYIERFRHGPPQSREERQHLDYASEDKHHPFWWIPDSESPHSSTPTKATNTEDTQPLKDDLEPALSRAGGRCQRYSRSVSPSRGSDTMLSEGEFDDTEILNLQERANRLLLQDECTLSDRSIHVSSEGVGCSDFTSPVSVDEPLRRPLTFGAVNSTSAKGISGVAQPASFKKSVFTPSLVTPLRPEEDILFQWRLRRKLEQARECPQPLQRLSLHGPTFNWQTPSVYSPSDSRGAYKERNQHSEFPPKASQPRSLPPQSETTESHPLCPPVSPAAPFPVASGSSVPEPQAIARVPALMHLHCDVLPCPAHCLYAGQQQNTSKKKHLFQSEVSLKGTQVPGNSLDIFPKDSVCEFRPASPPAASDPSEEAPPLQKRVEKHSTEETHSNNSEKLTTMPRKKLRKSRRTVEREHAGDSGATNTSSSHHKDPGDGTAQVEQRRRKGRQEKDDAPPPSPIQHALGQVVSEVLFPTRDSCPGPRTPVLSNSLPRPASTPPPASVSSSDALKSAEVISQLLQEAEDSDEKEFDDDPLLQVLRKQRTWVKEQISEVDSMLTELHNEQVT